MEINLIREQSITVRTRLPSTSAQATFRGNASLLRAGGGGADPVWAGQTRCGRDGKVWCGRGWGGANQGGLGGRTGRGEVGGAGLHPCFPPSERLLCAALPPRFLVLRLGYYVSGPLPDQGGGPGSGRHLLLHQKQAVSCHQCGSPPSRTGAGWCPQDLFSPP